MSPRFRQDSLKFFVCKRDWLVRTGIALGLAISGTMIGAAAPPIKVQAGVHYAQSSFTLPFHVKPGGRCPQSLDLLMSRDGGRSWQVHQSAAPAEGCFRIVQAEEGEYWLKVQVRDAAGSAVANSTMQLFVDATPPQATFKCDWQSDSKLFLSGMITDLHLDPQTVKLTMRTDVANEAVVVPVRLLQATADGAEYQAAMEMPNCKSFELRLTAADRAGNRMTTCERFSLPAIAGEASGSLLSTEFTESDASSDYPMGRHPAQRDWTDVELGAPKTVRQTQLVAMSENQQVVRKTPSPAPTQLEELIPPPRSQELTLEAPAPPPSARTESQVVSTSRKFKINYDLGASIAGAEMHVELWVTTDGGSTWEFWGLDRDAQAPAWIEVDAEGEYGFCVVCVHGDADMRFRPNAGDKPDLTVRVEEPGIRHRPEAASRN